MMIDSKPLFKWNKYLHKPPTTIQLLLLLQTLILPEDLQHGWSQDNESREEQLD